MTNLDVPFCWLEDQIRIGDLRTMTNSIGSLMQGELVEVLSIHGNRAHVESLATKITQEVHKKILR